MPGLRRLFAAAALAAALAPQLSRADDTALNPEAMRKLAAAAVAAGHPDAALMLTEALLARDPKDGGALILRARALRDSGDYAPAARAARQAWRLSETDAARHMSSLAMAQALASSGQRLRAQWWLRRAAHHAPTPAMRQRAVQDFRYVQARNPWATALSFSVGPRSNINNGSAHETTRLYDLPYDFRLSGAAQALSGTELSLGISTRYRLSESRRHKTDLLFRAHHRTYRLTDEARAQAPGVEGSDFAFGSLSATLAHEARAAGASGPHRFAATLGQTWYGGDPYMQFAQFSATRHWALSQRTGAHLSVTLEGQAGQGGIADSRKLRLASGVTRVIGGGHRLHLGVIGTASRSDDAARDYDRVEAVARVAFGQPVMGMELTLDFSAAGERYAGVFLGTSGREDNEFAVELTADLPAVEYYGFIPSLTLRASRTDSTITRYETEKLGVEVGWRSAF
jgi:tetratricopeptide (TPR) repeat protein